MHCVTGALPFASGAADPPSSGHHQRSAWMSAGDITSHRPGARRGTVLRSVPTHPVGLHSVCLLHGVQRPTPPNLAGLVDMDPYGDPVELEHGALVNRGDLAELLDVSVAAGGFPGLVRVSDLDLDLDLVNFLPLAERGLRWPRRHTVRTRRRGRPRTCGRWDRPRKHHRDPRSWPVGADRHRRHRMIRLRARCWFRRSRRRGGTGGGPAAGGRWTCPKPTTTSRRSARLGWIIQ